MAKEFDMNLDTEAIMDEAAADAALDVDAVMDSIPELNEVQELQELPGDLSAQEGLDVTAIMDAALPDMGLELPVEAEAIDEVPADAALLEELPVEAEAIDEVPADAALLEELPVEAEAIDEVPADAALLEEIPVEAEPTPTLLDEAKEKLGEAAPVVTDILKGVGHVVRIVEGGPVGAVISGAMIIKDVLQKKAETEQTADTPQA